MPIYGNNETNVESQVSYDPRLLKKVNVIKIRKKDRRIFLHKGN